MFRQVVLSFANMPIRRLRSRRVAVCADDAGKRPARHERRTIGPAGGESVPAAGVREIGVRGEKAADAGEPRVRERRNVVTVQKREDTNQ